MKLTHITIFLPAGEKISHFMLNPPTRGSAEEYQVIRKVLHPYGRHKFHLTFQ